MLCYSSSALTGFCAPCSYPFKRGKNKLGRGRDTSRPTTTIWQVCWRIIQMVFLWRSEILRLAVSDLESVNKKRLELQTPGTLRCTDYVLSNNKTTSFPFLAPLIDHVLHGVTSNCIVDSFVYWAVITEGHWKKRALRRLWDTGQHPKLPVKM